MTDVRQPLVDFTEISHSTDDWELFTRDLLKAMGLYIETPPSRGADLGKDLLVTETIEGKVSNLSVRWLVSCKHFAKSRKSVNENDDERNILERVRGFQADGFIGVYSTIASAGLMSRLEQLRDRKEIKDFRIIDHREIENRLLTAGYSALMMRYFPESYKRVKPIHDLGGGYVPLECHNCGKDLLDGLFRSQRSAVVVMLHHDENDCQCVDKVLYACKGECDQALVQRYRRAGQMDGWLELGDLSIPLEFMSRFFAMMNNIRDGEQRFSDEAYKEAKFVFVAMSQKVLRAMTDEEFERVKMLRQFPF